ncbi:hypothetical protein ACET3Z_031488 [Daucus carota]
MRRNRTLCSSGSDLIWTLNYFPLLFLNFLEMPLSGTQMRAIVIAITVDNEKEGSVLRIRGKNILENEHVKQKEFR